MPKKKNRISKIFENTEIESAEANVESTESVTAENDAVLSDLVPPGETADIPGNNEQSVGKESGPTINETPTLEASSSPEVEISADHLLDDVRRSLIEDETDEASKPKKWWHRIAKGLRRDQAVGTEQPVEVEMDLSVVGASADSIDEQAEGKESEEYLDQIDALIDMLETEADEKTAQATVAVEVPAEPERKVDIEEMKRQAFQPRPGSQEQENFSEVRSVALEGGEEVFVEVQSTAQDPLEERLTALENALRPYRRYIYFAFAFLGVVMAVVASMLLFNVYKQSQPAKPTEKANLPFPISMSLPGGLNFSLGKGALKDGEWNPRGPEWLEGTEVCRWVAIPWSRQLEAVIRTLNPDDPIELAMSNNDRLVYKVYSVRELSNEEMQKLETDSPCLLLVLAKADSDKRWVLTALP